MFAEAVEKVKGGELSAYNMQSKTGIPRTNIRNHTTGQFKIDNIKTDVVLIRFRGSLTV